MKWLATRTAMPGSLRQKEFLEQKGQRNTWTSRRFMFSRQMHKRLVGSPPFKGLSL